MFLKAYQDDNRLTLLLLLLLLYDTLYHSLNSSFYGWNGS